MLVELQKRPMVRPLFFWILGIITYVFLPHFGISAFFLFLAFFFLRFSRCGDTLDYCDRWHWGIVFSLLMLVSAILICACIDRVGENVFFHLHGLDWTNDVRTHLLNRLDNLHLEGSAKNFLSAILLGDTHELGKELRLQFSVTGVAHILSVSGFHVAVVCGFFSFLLSPLPSLGFFKWLKYGLTLSVLWGFTLITGCATPSVRAALMLSFFLTGRIIRRTTDSYNTLAASAFFMLVYNPFYLFDAGFQLSYMAVWFILLLKPPLDHLLDIHNPLLAQPYSWITVAVAAQTGTAFLCLYYFSQFPVLFLLTNLPFSLVSTLLIPAGLIYMLLPNGFPLTAFFAFSIEKMTTLLLQIVNIFSSYTWASFIIPFDFFDLLLGYIFLFLLVVFVYRKHSLSLFLSLISLSFLLIKFLLEALWFPAI